MRAVPAELDGITKSGGRLLFPGIKGCGSGQVVKSVVDLHRIKLLSVVGKPLRFRQVLGVKNAAPVIVMITGRADSGLAGPIHDEAPSCGWRILSEMRCQLD